MGRVPMGIGGILVLLVLSWFTGIDFMSLLGNNPAPTSESSTGTSGEVATTPEEEKTMDFVNAIIEDTQVTWEQLLGGRYQRTRASVFRDAVQSACGTAQSAVGPFYCPGDRRVYLDLSFFDELNTRFGAPGDFAQAYVLAHEYGHHIQNLTGILDKYANDQRTGPNSPAVAIELEADCYAGLWARNAVQTGFLTQLTDQDIKDALNAAAAVGDDLRRGARVRVAVARRRLRVRRREVVVRRAFRRARLRGCRTGPANGNRERCHRERDSEPTPLHLHGYS